jgi:hypothetical protein
VSKPVTESRERVALSVAVVVGVAMTLITFVSLVYRVFVYAPGRTLTLPRAVWWSLDALYAMPLPAALVLLLMAAVAVGLTLALLTLSAARSW